jgi:ketosteroid isomerase-like protein
MIFLPLLFLLFFLTQPVFSQDEEEIWSLEEDYISYFSKADKEAILSLYHPDFLGWPDSESHPAGKKRAAEFLEENYPEPMQVMSQITKEGIRIVDDIAITHYLVTFSWIDEDKSEHKTRTRITHTWIKENSEWKILGGMSSSK